MKWFGTSFAALAVLGPVFAIIDPTAPATPCVPSRTVTDAAIQTGIASGCQEDLDITEAVCSDYLAQEILIAISQFCGNQTEAFAYCNSLPDVSIDDCQYFDPSGGGVAPDCTQEAIDAYNICGNSTGSGLFADGDPVSLSQCLFYDLSLCTPEDGEGHFNTTFTGMPTDCPIPSYTPACGVYSTSSSAPTTTAPQSSPSSSSSLSAAPSFQTTEPGPPSSLSSSSLSSAAPSFQTTEPGPPYMTISTTTPITAPTAPPNPPPGASPYFYLTINGTFTEFVSVDGGVTLDSVQAQVFYILNGQLFTIDGLRIQVGQGAIPDEPAPYITFVGTNSALPFTTNFSLVTAGINPSSSPNKRQAVGLTTLYWTNLAFAAPGILADFCVYFYEVYALFQENADIYESCERVSLNAIYIETPGSASSSSVSKTIMATTTLAPLTFSMDSCPIGQTIFSYTTVYL